MEAISKIVLETGEQELENILSPFIREQFPNFMQQDYQKLILFVKAYYEWCDKQGNSSYVMSHLDTAFDIDQNLDEFLAHFESTYLSSFPLMLASNTSGNKPNRKTLLKKIRDFYGNKGTESAYKFLFRILYDSDLEIYYPKTDILKVSDGQWVEQRSIKTTSNNGNALFSAKGGTIVQFTGSSVTSSAFVDSVVQYSFNGIPVTEFFITDISGQPFQPDRSVRIVVGSTEYDEIPYSVLGDFYVDLPGEQYRIGDRVFVIDPTSAGVGFSAKIEQTDLAGGIKKIGIINSGLNYGADVVLQVFSDSNPGTRIARVFGLRTAVTNYPGYFSGNRGKVSSTKKVQDGHYYQEFSYELKSEVSFGVYFDVLKKLIHPTGTRMFGSILVKKALTNTVASTSQGTFRETPVIGKYTPYTPGTTLNLRNNGVTVSGYWLGATGDLYPLGYNPYIGSTAQVGPNGSTTSLGTVFVGSSLGYTWCYVPEGGRTSHNPIGAPLGGTVSWYLGQETVFSPQGMDGLVLWLKPENIGVCGSVANGASMDVWTDASPSANHALPPKWDRWTTDPTYAGVTIDKLRPTLVINDNGVVGATGISFDGGVIFTPQTPIRDSGGLTLASAAIGITFAPGSSGDKLLVGRHFYLTRGLTLTADMDMFLVYRPIVDSSDYGLGFVCSNRLFTDSYFSTGNEDNIVFSRSWNSIDRDPANRTPTYYTFTDANPQYPVGIGLLGFRPWGSFASTVSSSQKTTIAYDPHVSGQSMGMVIGEVVRDSANVLSAFANGDRATNRSPSTGLYVSNGYGSGAESPVPVCGVTVDIGRFGVIPRHDLVSSGTTGSNAWITQAITNTPYGFRGVLNEVIVFNRKLQETERQQVYGYLSRKYKMDAKLPEAFTRSRNSAYPFGTTYWVISHHPNSRQLTTIPAGICFGGITLSRFMSLPSSLYKSSGTVLSNGTVLSGDTYSNTGS